MKTMYPFSTYTKINLSIYMQVKKHFLGFTSTSNTNGSQGFVSSGLQMKGRDNW